MSYWGIFIRVGLGRVLLALRPLVKIEISRM